MLKLIARRRPVDPQGMAAARHRPRRRAAGRAVRLRHPALALHPGAGLARPVADLDPHLCRAPVVGASGRAARSSSSVRRCRSCSSTTICISCITRARPSPGTGCRSCFASARDEWVADEQRLRLPELFRAAEGICLQGQGAGGPPGAAARAGTRPRLQAARQGAQRHRPRHRAGAGRAAEGMIGSPQRCSALDGLQFLSTMSRHERPSSPALPMYDWPEDARCDRRGMGAVARALPAGRHRRAADHRSPQCRPAGRARRHPRRRRQGHRARSGDAAAGRTRFPDAVAASGAAASPRPAGDRWSRGWRSMSASSASRATTAFEGGQGAALFQRDRDAAGEAPAAGSHRPTAAPSSRSTSSAASVSPTTASIPCRASSR